MTQHHTPETQPQPSAGVGRRGVLAGAGVATVAGLFSAAASAAPAHASGQPKPNKSMPVRFGADGKLRIVQFNDTQDTHLTDRRTIELIEKTLDSEKPGLVVLNGDVINGTPSTDTEVKQAYNNVLAPIEERGIKFALTFGNHDEDSLSHNTSMTEPAIVDWLHSSYEHNINPEIDADLMGHSNGQVLLQSSASKQPAFGVWLFDSNRYAPSTIGGQSRKSLMNYDWIHGNQVQWYRETSAATEKHYGRKIPSLAFFHIPLWEHHHMWFGSQFGSDESTHAAAAELHSIVGEKNEGVYVGAFNSGLYAAMQERGDVRGVYVGHDHVNTYSGNYFGIELGYGPGTGFGTYGFSGAEQHRLRGARVFELDENAEGVYTGTRTVFAADLGIDTSPGHQRISEPAPLP
ncbi:metallophosphoesterase family protein [Zhihengliuella flava]|uniref:3',5'-cyclic AMP phosphodiesterase CpdA n=1 Tax=Zhihengliuella flava TaxID=1285193 RepID=A0A931D6F9_9MICC|nr:metallophosphoesterase family protein [Zhihengliuella flava]MBG6084565.1 3',5'-cyclic AMP phosphodiesterase CpdA [Zhihengliuella flava]